MRPTMPARFPVRTAQNWRWPAAACAPAARGSNPVRAYRMDPTNGECIVCSGTREMPGQRGNRVATNIRLPDAIGSRSCASETYWRLAVAANCPHGNRSIWRVVASSPYIPAPHASCTGDAVHGTPRPMFQFPPACTEHAEWPGHWLKCTEIRINTCLVRVRINAKPYCLYELAIAENCSRRLR